AVALTEEAFVRTAGDARPIKLSFKIVDKYGVPVANVPVRFDRTIGGGRIVTATPTTDGLGIGQALNVMVGGEVEEEQFAAQAGGHTVYFDGITLAKPTVKAGDGVSSATHQAGSGLAPGSYIELYGNFLSESSQ